MELIIGTYVYLTKIHLLDLKHKLKQKFEYTRADFDYILIKKDSKTTIKIAQDGLIYIKTKEDLNKINELYSWLKKNVISKLSSNSEASSFFKNAVYEKKPTIIITNPQGPIKKIYKKLGRSHDYTFKGKYLTKDYGRGLAIYSKIKLNKSKLNELVENQIILADYQKLTKILLVHNKKIEQEVKKLRKQKKLTYKDLPLIIDELLEKKRLIISTLQKINQLDDFLNERLDECNILNVLEDLKLNDFKEMVGLNNYIKDQFNMTKEYISSTLDLIGFIYNENEQKEMNILQVIFAIGTIATIVGLGAMPGAKIILKMTDNGAVGEIISFSTKDLLFWTVMSVVIGIGLFMVLNYVFTYAKKLKIVNLIKK